MKWIPCVGTEVMVKIKHPEELKLSSWFKCKVLGMMTMEFLSWEPLIYPGHSIQQSGEDLKEGYIFLCLNLKPG